MSNPTINDRLMEARERLRHAQKLRSMMREAIHTLTTARARAEELEAQLADEKADVDALEGLSLTALFHRLLGSQEDKLVQERQEYLAAKLKYEEGKQQVADTEGEIARLNAELKPLAGVDQEYDALIQEKETWLQEAGNEDSIALLTLSEELADLQADRKELAEAVQAGESALGALSRVSSNLDSAENWGTWDMMGGGGLTTMAKHQKIDAARDHARVAQKKLNRLRGELADVGEELRASIELGDFSRFVDFFFDGLIADWSVQSKIKNAKSACAQTIRQVERITVACRRRKEDTDAKIRKLNERRKTLIEEA